MGCVSLRSQSCHYSWLHESLQYQRLGTVGYVPLCCRNEDFARLTVPNGTVLLTSTTNFLESVLFCQVIGESAVETCLKICVCPQVVHSMVSFGASYSMLQGISNSRLAEDFAVARPVAIQFFGRRPAEALTSRVRFFTHVHDPWNVDTSIIKKTLQSSRDCRRPSPLLGIRSSNNLRCRSL